MKESARAKETTKSNAIPTAEMAEATLKNYEQAMRMGLKMQEEAGRWWTSMFNQGSFAQEWQKRFNDVNGVASSLMPLTEKRMEEVINLMEKNTKAGAELMKKAVDAAQTPGAAESQAKWLDFWT